MKILLVEDNPSSQLMVTEVLSPIGHEVIVAGTAAEASKVLKDTEIHLLLLDMGLPDSDGLDFYAQLQTHERTRGIPVMILTAREDVSNKVAAFSLGVDDYIVKPFNVLEFRARVEAKLKKIQGDKTKEEVISRGPLTINVPRQKAFITEGKEQQEIELTPLEFRLLYQLARREEHVLTRAQLLDLVWGQAAEILDRTVDAHISMLRKKLGSLSSCIRSVAGEGYSFTSKPIKKPTNSRSHR